MAPTCVSKSWIREQFWIRQQLIHARNSPDPTHLSSLVHQILDRYEIYYQTRSDPVQAFCSPFATNLERATYWVSGWRPTTLIHLLYTESGLKFEAQLFQLLSGARSGDIGDISTAQLGLIDEVQRRTVKDEIEIDGELGQIQDGLPDPFLPADSDLDLKLEEIGRVIDKADRLRMRTLRNVVRILNPLQAVDLLVAVADWEIGVRELGLELERRPVHCGTRRIN